MNQETRINKIINESLQAFEQLCLENDINRVRKGGCRYLLESISGNHFWLKRNVEFHVRELIFKLDSQCKFTVHRILRKRLFRNSNGVSTNGRLRRRKQFWRIILVDHIQNSGVSIRTSYSAESGPWESGPGVIRIVPYQTENQLLKSLLNAFTHQIFTLTLVERIHGLSERQIFISTRPWCTFLRCSLIHRTGITVSR